MLTRQKVLLRLLELADRPVPHLELMSWAFLLRSEAVSKGGNAFYDFVTTRTGPVSFSLEHEIRKLAERNFVFEVDGACWRVNPDCVQAAAEITNSIDQEIRRLLARLGDFAVNQLLDSVSEHHPADRFVAERALLPPVPKALLAIYTAGYESLSVDRFLNLLVQNGIERLIDVRNNPSSRRYGFHKSTLNRLSAKLGMAYVHFPELGIYSAKRQLFPADGNRSALFDDYENSTLSTEINAQESISELMTERPSVLVCMESDPACCHRSRLADRIARITNLPICHLRV